MADPILNDKTLEAARAGWAAPKAPSPGGQVWAPPTPSGARVSDGPVSTWKGAMTVNGTLTATGVLFALLLAAGTAGWLAVEEKRDELGNVQIQFPGLAMVGVAIGIGIVFAIMFKPHLAKFLAPAYAIAQGFAVGAVSKAYESFQDGIVIQAVGATLGVVAVMLVLYRTRIIRVTDRFRKVVTFATLGVMAFYLVSFVVNIFGGDVVFFNEPNALGILVTAGIALLAAFNLLLRFDFIEKGTQMGLSKDFEWYAGFGLMVTIVWLYLELLRLLSLLQQR
jgi:uncharacterized YccA/Bax inhibitor family protein